MDTETFKFVNFFIQLFPAAKSAIVIISIKYRLLFTECTVKTIYKRHYVKEIFIIFFRE